MGNTAARDAKRLRGAERARRACELRIEGKTLQAIADELGYAHRTSVKKAIDAYRREIPREATEELRELDLERSEHAYKGARAAADKLEGAERVDAEVKVSRIVKNHAEIGGVIKSAPAAVVSVTQTQSTLDVNALDPEGLMLVHALKKKLAEKAEEESPVDRTP